MRRWLKRGLILVILFVGLPVAFYSCHSWHAGRELRSVVAELDANSAPWRWNDLLAARPPVSKSDDALALVLKVDQIVPAGFSSNPHVVAAFDKPPHVALSAEQRQKFHEAMTSVEAGLSEARKLAGMPQARFRVRFPPSVPGAIDLGALRKARALVVLLEYGAAWHTQQGDMDGALHDCLAMQRASQSLQDELTLMPHLVRMAMEAISVNAVQGVLAQGQPAASHLKQLQHLQQAWEQFDRKSALANALLGERAWSDEWFKNLGRARHSFDQALESEKSFWDDMSVWERIRMRQSVKDAHAWELRQTTAYLESLNLPEQQRRARQEELTTRIAEAPGIAGAGRSIPQVLQVDRRNEAQIRCMIAGIAAERFRREHGRWPATLAELTPEFLKKVPADPYADQPLQLRRTGDGIVIYSVGPDGKQRGTYQEDRAAGRPSLRYEFRLWDVARRRQMMQP